MSHRAIVFAQQHSIHSLPLQFAVFTDQHALQLLVRVGRWRHHPPANMNTGRCVRSTTCASPTGVFSGLLASVCMIAWQPIVNGIVFGMLRAGSACIKLASIRRHQGALPDSVQCPSKQWLVSTKQHLVACRCLPATVEQTQRTDSRIVVLQGTSL